MRKRLIAIVMVMILTFGTTGCASCSRKFTDIKNDLVGGLQRTIKVYTANGDLIAEYEGKIDIETNDGGYVKFDYNG